MDELLREVRNCKLCEKHLPLGPNPILAASRESRIAIIGQAPGAAVHKSGVPWEDKSGDRLREWLGVDRPTFYDENCFALVPMGFCYPGKGKSGDMPPRPECAPEWHDRLIDQMHNLKLTILTGAYAHGHYLRDRNMATLTETVKHYRKYLPTYFVLPHPSPRNNIWLRKNPWFGEELVPKLQSLVSKILQV